MRMTAVLALPLVTIGCQPSQPADPCGAAYLADLIGQDASAAQNLQPGPPIRILYPDTPRTESYSPSRANIEIGEDGRIASVWCG